MIYAKDIILFERNRNIKLSLSLLLVNNKKTEIRIGSEIAHIEKTFYGKRATLFQDPYLSTIPSNTITRNAFSFGTGASYVNKRYHYFLGVSILHLNRDKYVYPAKNGSQMEIKNTPEIRYFGGIDIPNSFNDSNITFSHTILFNRIMYISLNKAYPIVFTYQNAIKYKNIFDIGLTFSTQAYGELKAGLIGGIYPLNILVKN